MTSLGGFTVEENHIGKAVFNNIRYTQTERQKDRQTNSLILIKSTKSLYEISGPTKLSMKIVYITLHVFF